MLLVLKIILPFIPFDLQKTVMMALIASKMDYCNALYLGTSKCLIKKLQSLQNATARTLLNIPKFKSVSHLLRGLHWLPVQKRISFKALCLMHKALHKTGPSYFQERFSWYTPSRNLRSSSAFMVMVPRIKRVNWGGRTLPYLGGKLWNSLPLALRSQSTLQLFRKQLKTWLFPL